MGELQFTNFVRKPFNVEAIEITTENIAELAPLIGTLKHKDSGQPYIHVDRRLVPNIYKVHPGFWMTRMGDNIRCYARKIFLEQFVETTPELQTWIDFLNDDNVEVTYTTETPEVEHVEVEVTPISELPQPVDASNGQS